MNIPNLPTDNLYKFMALSGVALVLISLFYPSKLIGQLQITQSEVQTNIDILQHEADQHNAAIKKNKDLPLEEYEKAIRRINEFQIKKIKLQGEHRKSTILLKQASAIFILSIFGSFIGLSLAIYGFRLWYVRVQHPNDVLANRQANDA